MHFEQIALTEAAASSLASGGSPFLWQRIKQDIEENKAQVFQASNGSYLVLSIQKPDLVCHAMTGCDANEIAHSLIDLARLNDCEFVRFVTRHKGFPRLLRDHKLLDFGTIYRIKAYESND